MKFTWKGSLILVSILTLLLGGCSQGMNVSADEIIHNAIESEKEVHTYYGESEMKVIEGKEVTQHAILEENVADEKRKVTSKDLLLDEEVEVLNDGKKMLMYEKSKGVAYEMEMTELGDFAGLSPKEQFKSMVETMKDSHHYEMVGEAKILDYDTYHIQVKAKEADNLLGDMELWVDQKTWFVVKIVSEMGDVRTELEYTDLDFSPDFAEDTFTINIPEDVEIESLEESLAPDEVTVEEAEGALGQAFRLFPDGDEFHLSSVNMYDFSSEMDRHEVELNYSSKEDIPFFTVSVFPTPEGMEIEEGDLEIRGNTAQYEEMINGIIWDEDGLRYSLLITNPDIEQEVVTKWTEDMVLSSEQ